MLMHNRSYGNMPYACIILRKDSAFYFTRKLIAYYKAHSFSRIENVVCNFVLKLVKGFNINTWLLIRAI